jgi:hypothetical protein
MFTYIYEHHTLCVMSVAIWAQALRMFSGPFSSAALAMAFSLGAVCRPFAPVGPASLVELGGRGELPAEARSRAAPAAQDADDLGCPPCRCNCVFAAPATSPEGAGGPASFLLRLGADLQWAGLSCLAVVSAFLLGCCCSAARGHPAEARSRVPAALARLEGYRF